MTSINRNYKDRLFTRLFGDAENKSNLLSLFNALNATEYSDPDDLVINTLDDAIYMNMKNDVSCIISSYMSLYEHQSTFNPNMPYRGFQYFAEMYEKYRVENGLNMFKSKLQMIPTPQYYVFYNGSRELPDRMELRLSDAFVKPVKEGAFEWTAIMLNINIDHNQELLSNCKPLCDYASLISKIREEKAKHSTIDLAVNNAVNWCIQNHILENYLRLHKTETI